ncbi:MAG: class I poly(R)-hydroxyalkanoic acid synthase [Betaproteobacteria bacterium]|nr:class I poly(R)-hydroxyalkanoic acid synthase [Betaproteobacteria bacterium]MDH4293377.1 class I poly(R)-hydroxyalkanoic acid synthase [Betaproteobacteria bacterium]MDH5341560.1 class I poly(R)-hydroxyalkanoic acid synthase [Betaproteobacteria bacterium]
MTAKQTQTETPAMDHAEMARLYADIAEKSGALLTKYMARSGSGVPAMKDELGIAKAFFEAWGLMLTDPVRVAEMQMKLWQDYMALWQNSMSRMMGQETAPVAQPNKTDRRFRHEDWENNFLYDYVKQSYLIAARHLHQSLGSVEGLDEKTAKKVDFYTRQYIDALSPSNFLLTNPEALRETVSSGGQNLVKGLNNLLEDLTRGNGEQLRVRMTDSSAFKLGENLATTKGKVVFQNDIMQLIQYAPLTDKVHATPLLIIPPWINKFYILDMRENNSFVRWAVEQGHTVFMVSWVNPDEKLAHKRFDDYLTDGSLAALDVIRDITGEAQANVIGYCLGGTLLACTLAWLAAKKQDRIRSATFFVTMIDFERPGELEVFIDEQQVSALEKKMEERGYLEGSEMATTFNMLRANDLIWSFVVNNYLLGKDPFPFDLLHWNGDSTRMPAAMHSFYLRNLYLKNLLRTPGGVTLAGTPIDITKVKVPAYFISTVEDHIAPWQSTYAGARMLQGPVRFVLGGSGHIAGIINPPAANKYGYWVNDKLDAQPDSWLAKATQHAGSWWTDWGKWAAKHGDKKIAARKPGNTKFKAIEDAPGSYVQQRIG